MSQRHPRGGDAYGAAGRIHTLRMLALGAPQPESCEGASQRWQPPKPAACPSGPASWFACCACGAITGVSDEQIDHYTAAAALGDMARVYRHQAMALDEMAATGVVYAGDDAAAKRARADHLDRIAAKLAPTTPEGA
jgi:hypothetical protein